MRNSQNENNTQQSYGKSIAFAALWTLTSALCMSGGVICIKVLNCVGYHVPLILGAFALLSLTPPVIYIAFCGKNKRSFYLRGSDRVSFKDTLYFLPLAAAALPVVCGGLKIDDYRFTLSVLMFACAFGLCQELYFRAIMMHTLSCFGQGAVIVLCALSGVFGAVPFAFLSGDVYIILLFCAIILVFGFVAAELVTMVKSVYPMMSWGFCFVALTAFSTASGSMRLILFSIQLAILLVYAIYLWFSIFKRNTQFTDPITA